VPTDKKSRLLRDFVAAAQAGDENAALQAARETYAAFLSGEISLADSDAIDPDLEWLPPGQAPTAGTYRGAGAAEQEVGSWTEPFDDFYWEPVEVLLGGDCLVVGGRMGGTGRGSGIEVEQEEFHVWTLRDGRVVRMQMFLDRGEALAAAGIGG
jgi:ketosteroid isomerase-like protein